MKIYKTERDEVIEEGGEGRGGTRITQKTHGHNDERTNEWLQQQQYRTKTQTEQNDGRSRRRQGTRTI